MAGNFQCPQGQICSDAYGTAVGSRNTNLFVRTSTAIQQGSGTQVTGGTTTLYSWVPDTTSGFTYGTGQGSWQPAARSSDGKTWTLLKDSKGQNVLGTDAANSLLSPTGNLNKNVLANTTKTLQQKGGLTTQQSQTVVKTNADVGTATAGAGTSPTVGIPNSTGTPTQTFSQQESFEGIKGLNVRTSYANLSYPIKRSQKQDYIKFEMLEYAPRKFSGNTLSGLQAAANGGSIDAFLGQPVFDTRDQFFKDAYKKDRKAIGTVSLPISSPISDTNSVSWSDDEMGAFTVLGAGIFKDLVSGSGTQTPQTPPPDSPGTGNAQTKTLVINELTKAALSGTGNANLLTRTTGAVINPNIELLFKGPSLRTFSFTFPLLARSKEESEQILQIIRFFKQGMSVKRSESALFLKSPHTFAIKYIYAREENKAIVESTHPWINQIKECALTNCSVNYTPAGNYATYANGAMTMYEITLNFSELEPIFDDDYANMDNNDGNSAGKDKVIGY